MPKRRCSPVTVFSGWTGPPGASPTPASPPPARRRPHLADVRSGPGGDVEHGPRPPHASQHGVGGQLQRRRLGRRAPVVGRGLARLGGRVEQQRADVHRREPVDHRVVGLRDHREPAVAPAPRRGRSPTAAGDRSSRRADQPPDQRAQLLVGARARAARSGGRGTSRSKSGSSTHTGRPRWPGTSRTFCRQRGTSAEPPPDQRDERRRSRTRRVRRREGHHAADVHRPGAVLGEEERRVERRQAVRHPAERRAVGRSRSTRARGSAAPVRPRSRWQPRAGTRRAGTARSVPTELETPYWAQSQLEAAQAGIWAVARGAPRTAALLVGVVVAGGAALDAAGRGAAARDGGGHGVRAAVDRRRLHEPAGGGPDAAAGRRRAARARRGRRRAGGARGAPVGERVGAGAARAADRGARPGRALQQAGRRRAGRVRRRRLHHAGPAGPSRRSCTCATARRSSATWRPRSSRWAPPW